VRGQKVLAKAYVWLGDGEPEWAHTKENPPALTSGERINSSHTEKTAMVREALERGGERAAQFKSGMVDGVLGELAVDDGSPARCTRARAHHVRRAGLRASAA
jgi:hypothetical protein